MSKSSIFGLIASTVLLFGAGGASALNLEVGIFLASSTFANSVTTNSVGDLSGLPNNITVSLTPGDVIALGFYVENNDGEDISAIFTSLVSDSTLIAFSSGGYYSGVLLEAGAMAPPSLSPGPPAPAEKPNSPKAQNTGTTSWVQAMAHTNAAGTTGAGPDVAGFATYTYTGTAGMTAVDLEIAVTAGDGLAIVGGGPLVGFVNFSDAGINVPEPGTLAASMVSLGSVALVAFVRRRRIE